MLFAAVHESGFGPSETCGDACFRAAVDVAADVINGTDFDREGDFGRVVGCMAT
jgi:hypothetical protein